MKKYKIYFCLIIVFLIFIIFPLNNILAKYIFTESIIAANINIDRTKPKVEVSYSKKDITNDKVVVTVKANEEIKQIEGWQLQKDKKTLIKEYNKNIIEEIEIQDLSGNKTRKTINISQINKEASQNVIKDDAGNTNIRTEENSNIAIDNTNSEVNLVYDFMQ